jgi:hypothetical protein
MTRSPVDAAQSPAAPGTGRVVVIVPRREPGVHEYLQRALACVKDVEVVLDRRALTVTRPDDRRRPSAEKQLLICSLARCPADPLDR